MTLQEKGESYETPHAPTCGSLDGAVDEIKRLSSTNLDDHVQFRFSGAHSIKANDEYRNGASVTFDP